MQPDRVTVTVATDRPGWVISNKLTGMHFVYAFERDSLYADERVADWMRRARVGTIRWPGGTAVQHYHWDSLNGIAFKEDSWDPNYDQEPAPASEYMDLDEYIAFCRRVGAEPMVGINTRSGKVHNRMADSFDEARRLIQYCKDKDYRVKQWYIGNECFKEWSADAYAKSIDAYAEVLKEVDPDITIIGDWKYGPTKKRRFEQSVHIAKTSTHIDVLEVHEKWGNKWGLNDGGGPNTLQGWQKEPGIYGGHLDRFTQRFLDEMEGAGKDVRIAFNEWGCQMGGRDATPYHIALVKADYLISMFRFPTYSACDWNLNMGPGQSKILRTTDGGHRLTGFSPAVTVFEMVGEAQEGRHLPMSTDHPVVYGFAALGPEDGALRIYLLNKLSTAVRADLDLGDEDVQGASVGTSQFTDPGKLVRASLTTEEGVAVELPPLSFTMIRIKR